MLRLDSKENGWIHFYLLRIYWVVGFVCVWGGVGRERLPFFLPPSPYLLFPLEMFNRVAVGDVYRLDILKSEHKLTNPKSIESNIFSEQRNGISK